MSEEVRREMMPNEKMSSGLPATCLGYPRFGVRRELKRALEAYWAKKLSAEELLAVSRELRQNHWKLMETAGMAFLPTNDFSLYDHMLDMAVAVGAVPSRYRRIQGSLHRYFAMARGRQDAELGIDVRALEMTKWFDTNYHYIVPEIEEGVDFALDASKILAELQEAKAFAIKPRPVITGPVTFLALAKTASGSPALTQARLDALLPVYEKLFAVLTEKGVSWIQLDEPWLSLKLDGPQKECYQEAFARLSALSRRPRILLSTYFGPLGDNLPLATHSGVEGMHVDLVRGKGQLSEVLDRLPSSMLLSLGLVDGRNIWRTDLDAAHALVRRAVRQIGEERVVVASSCSLLHVPEDATSETRLEPELMGWLAFARQKLDEVKALAVAGVAEAPSGSLFEESRAALKLRRASLKTRNPEVRARAEKVTDAMHRRASPFADRRKVQQERFSLPALPTTTIGSFPQTAEVRQARAGWRSGRIAPTEYDAFLKEETKRCIQKQEDWGIDVLVHGEFERTDMVEYFGEKLEGFAFTENGWVQSYGSRCVKPPILFGDVARPQPMTVEWSRYAQSLTRRPMKGMLTGPVTILQWSFVRDDQPRSATCQQIALALRDEVADLEAAGIPMIQVDEPALREGLPLRADEWEAYLRWAVDAFRLSTSGVRDETQIHTHMCYAEFGDILSAIAEMDADVLSIETSRSKMELLADFGSFRYTKEVGPGVYDIHSPRVPPVEEMVELLGRAAKVLPVAQLWVNPDCGLKTRGWPEVEEALRNMVAAARLAREKWAARL